MPIELSKHSASKDALPAPSSHNRVTPKLLLVRLDSIASSLRDSGHAMGLLGLGSVGNERMRLDKYSDLDFFVMAEAGYKQRYIAHLDWLAAAHPLAWSFQNTADGHKALMVDGVFCEFAVFEPNELARIPFAPGHWVWRREDLPEGLSQPQIPMPHQSLPDETWIVGEALSCVFVGLQRWHRGEKLSAARFVQSYALDRLIELDALRAAATPEVPGDPFNRERRLERRQPELAGELPALLPGYEKTPQAALAVLEALERRHAALNPAVAQCIRAMAEA